MTTGAQPTQWQSYRDGEWFHENGAVIAEILITIYVNGFELASIMATPQEQEYLALGFLKNEKLIESLDEVEILNVSQAGCCVDMWLNHAFEKPARTIITTGCGGGVTFTDPKTGVAPLDSEITLAPEALRGAFRKLQSPDSLYARAKGVHAAGLLDIAHGELAAVVEDVGRHNAIDKLAGRCLKDGIETRDRALLVTGRVSSEMLRKAAVMGCPIVASRTSPTSLSLEMAEAWGITLVGYVRAGGMKVYAHPERIMNA